MDLGDMYAPGKLREQTMMKFKLTMKALSLMQYSAISFGKEEARIPLLNALAETILNDKPTFKVLAANLTNKGDFVNLIEDGTVTNTDLKVGIVAAIGKSVSDEIIKIDPGDNGPKFGDNAKILPEILPKQNPDIRVLLYQGTQEEAKNLVNTFSKPGSNVPVPHVIVCLSKESEPPPQEVIGHTQILSVGHKGRYVGVIGCFRNANGSIELHYDQVKLDDEFETPKDQVDNHPIMKRLEEYTKEVKDKDLLGQWPQVMHAMQVTFPNEKYHPAYVGSDRCKTCHAPEYEIWENTKHAVAFEALLNAKHPSNRQFDGECVQCHTVGFGYITGYRDEMRTPHLKHVGCESCHGPGSLHIDQPKAEKYQLAMSPWKSKKEDHLPTNAIEISVDHSTCQKCHDTDNDPYFKFKDFWPKVAHGPSAKKK
jgi:hypothetical protein